MAFTELDRKFVKWRDERAQDDDFRLFERSFYGEVSWDELLKYQRVVVLAEAGSGKSRELEERHKKLRDVGEFAFHATVQNVAKAGLEGALDAASKAKLEEWRNSEAVAWFFIDSVDEAKLDDIRFVDALRKIGDGLGLGLPRARIILSGRFNSWEFRADLERVIEVLPIASLTNAGSGDPSQVLTDILNKELRGKKARTEEKPLVVLMAPLTEAQVRLFAEGQGVTQTDAFMDAIEKGNLWRFARRPLDLGWLVDYWQQYKHFGRFADILEASIRARLQEDNPQRQSRDELDVEKSFAAMERVGAAMVFGRFERIEIPDSAFVTPSSSAAKLRQILPDWPADYAVKLLLRPVFDPASLGQMHLHNDNEGVVRGYLAARWLRARLNVNAPRSRIFELLFGEADGVPIVLPSAKETAAWLSAWDDSVAVEVIKRDPGLLLTAGDPSSLKLDLRRFALEGLIGQLADGAKRHEHLDEDALRRFSTSEMMPALRAGWGKHRHCKDVRRLILTMIEVGQLTDGLPIVREALDGTYTDRTTALFAIRALARIGEASDFETLAEKVRTDANSLDNSVVWEALEALFPNHLPIDDFMAVLGTLGADPTKSGEFGWRARPLVERLKTRDGFRTILARLLAMIGAKAYNEDDEDDTPDEERLLPMIQAAASGLLRRLPKKALEPVIVEAAIRLRADRVSGRRLGDDEFQPQLLATSERRRLGLWKAVELLESHPRLRGNGLTNLWQLDLVGWNAGVTPDDISWLLEDARTGETPTKRRLALGAVMPLWRDTGKSEELFRDIRQAAEQAQLTEFVDSWLKPPELSAAEMKHQERAERIQKKNAADEKKRNKSWFEFVDKLKADPARLRNPLANLKPGNVDGRLFYIWELLYASSEDRTGYAIDDFGRLAVVLGPDVTKEAISALIRFWRQHEPTLTSSRAPDARNVTSKFDSMAIAGVSLEAAADKSWADNLSSAEANKAASLATLELNGFPNWLNQLAEAWPDEVQSVFVGESMDHLSSTPTSHGFLDKLVYTEPAIAALVAPTLLNHIRNHPDLEEGPLSRAFGVIGRALEKIMVPEEFVTEILRRFRTSENASIASLYLGFAMRVAPTSGLGALTAKLDQLAFPDQKALAEYVLPAIFGDRWFRGGVDPKVLPYAALERLVGIAFRTIRQEDDQVHDGVYSPNPRDHAEEVRSSLFNHLVNTPGRQTVEALRRLDADADVSISSERICELIHERTATDAEHAPWVQGEALELEKQFDVAPRTPRDLQLVGLSRIAEIDHDLHHHRFAQGQTVKALPKERDVQKWAAHELDHRKGRAYTVEREPHVADEKEPDIWLQSTATDASAPLEIKVAESWTLAQLEEALIDQLVGRYLRERNKRHGTLLLVHQKARSEGWYDKDGALLSFPEVVAHLRRLAKELGAEGPDPVHVEIAVIDVSDIVISSSKRSGNASKFATTKKIATKKRKP